MTGGATNRTIPYCAVVFNSQVNALMGSGTMFFTCTPPVLQPGITISIYGSFTNENVIAGCQDAITDEQ